jgi:hypothetical protein
MTMFGIGFAASLVTLPFAIASAIVIAVPLFRFYARRGFTSILAYVLAGAVISSLLALAILLANEFAGFLTGGSDLQLALSIIFIGGPVAALTVRSVGGIRAN